MAGGAFYLRSGKGMSCRTTQIVIQFKQVPYILFEDMPKAPIGNRLVIQVQPAEGIQMHFETKVPDSEMRTRTSTLDFSFQGNKWRKVIARCVPASAARRTQWRCQFVCS